MSTQEVPERYQPSDRVIDDSDRLKELYCHRDLSIREIASEYASVSRAAIGQALIKHGINDGNEDTAEQPDSHNNNCDRGTDPPEVDWSRVA